MQPNPIASLLRSRKFLLAMLDALVSSTALVLTWFLSPDKVASVLALIGIWQPVCIAVIIGIAAEDVALSKAGAEMYKADVDAEAYGTAVASLPPLETASGEPVGPVAPCDEPKTQG
jgi:hypothetical protein